MGNTEYRCTGLQSPPTRVVWVEIILTNLMGNSPLQNHRGHVIVGRRGDNDGSGIEGTAFVNAGRNKSVA